MLPNVSVLKLFSKQIVTLKSAALEEGKTRQEDKKQVEVYQSHSKFMKAKVTGLEGCT